MKTSQSLSRPNTYEDILEELGTTGRYQILVFFLIISLIFAMGCHFKFMIYGGIFPKEIACATNQSQSREIIQESDWSGISNETHSPCGRSLGAGSVPNDCLTDHKSLNASTVSDLMLVNRTEACYDYKNMHFHSIAAEWNLVGTKRIHVSTVISVQMAGIFVGPLIAGSLSDRFGRKKALLVETGVMGISGFAAGFSPNWETFAAIRFFIGMSAGATLSTAFVFASEIMLKSWRVLSVTIPWPMNYFYFTLLAWLTRDWRIMSWAVNATIPIALAIEVFIFESPKWLLARNRPDEARKVLLKIAKMNGVDAKKLVKIMDSTQECCNWLLVDSKKEGGGAVRKQTFHYYHLFYSRQASISCIALMVSFAAGAGHYYCILYNIGNIATNPFVLTLILAVLESGITIGSNFIDYKVPLCGRRQMLLFGLICSAIADGILGIIYVTGIQVKVPWVPSIPSIAGLSMSVFFWIGANMVSVEVFPTELRNMGNSLCNTAARIGGILGPQILTLTYIWTPAPYFLFVLILIAATTLAFFTLPETKNMALPDLPKKFKNESV